MRVKSRWSLEESSRVSWTWVVPSWTRCPRDEEQTRSPFVVGEESLRTGPNRHGQARIARDEGMLGTQALCAYFDEVSRRWLNGASSMASALGWIVKGRVVEMEAPHKQQALGCAS
jgi:hypothetical protein